MELAERIEQLRKCRGMSQEQLGLELGVSRQAVSKWESNQSKPDVDTIIKMCELFQVSADWLLRGVEPAAPAERDSAAPRWGLDWLDRRFILGLVLIGLGALGVLALQLLSGGRMHEYMGYGRGLWGYVGMYGLWPIVLAFLILIAHGFYWVLLWLKRWLAKK